MTDHSLVPCDGSPLAERALDHTQEKFPEASITARYVIDTPDSIIDVEAGGLPVADEWYDTARERATTIHATATERAAAHDVELDTITEGGRPAREIVHYADEHASDQISMGSHGRQGRERAISGSVAATLTSSPR